MLQMIRDRAQGFFTWIIVGLIILSFALWGLNSYFSETDEGYQAALVNDVKVTVNEYQIAYQNERARMQQMFGENFDPDLFDAQIKNSALEAVIDNSLLIQNAVSNDMYVSDAQLSQRVQLIDSFMEDGKFSKLRYEQLLAQSGESTAGFEYRIRRGMIADQLVNGIIESSFATEDEINLTLRLRDQERELAYVSLPTSKYNADIEVTDEEIKKHYDGNQDNYKTEEQVQLSYLELSVDDLKSKVNLEDGEIEEYYEDQKARFMSEEQRQARHILVELGDDSDAAKAKAQSVYEKTKTGESFETLVKENSDDIGSASEGGDLGFFGRGVMDENFEDAVFAMNVGDISEPVKSEFGYHIIQLEAVKAPEGKSFEKVKDDLASELKKQKAEKLYFEAVEKLANLTYEIPESLDAAKEELELTVKTSPFIGKAGGPGLFSNRKITDAAFSDEVLKDNLNSALIELSNSRSMVVRLNEHKTSQVRPLTQVSEQIKNSLITEKALEKAKTVAGEIETKIKAGTSGSDAVKETGLTWNEKKWLKRTSSEVPRELAQALFSMPRNMDSSVMTEGVTLNNGDYALLVYTGVKDPDLASISEDEKKSVRDGIANATGVDAFTAYLKALKDEAEIKRFPSNL